MIKINLATRKQPLQSAGKSSGTGGFNLSGMSGIGSLGGGLFTGGQLRDAVGELPWKRAAMPVIVAVLAGFGAEYLKDSDIHRVEEEIAVVEADKPKLQAEIQKMKQAEETKRTLESDEAVLRTKVETIRKLVDGRGATAKLLIELAKNTPSDVWLNDVKVESAKVELQGYSMGFTQISDFMKALGESAFFADWNLKNTQTVKDETGGEVNTFELAGKRKQP